MDRNFGKTCKYSVTPYNATSKILRPQHTLFCNDTKNIGANNPNYISSNQRLAGPANPKTKIPPVVVPPPADLDYWRANNLINHSHINTESQNDTYLSGYQVSNCCDNIDACIEPITTREDFEYVGISDPNRPASSKCNPLQLEENSIISPTPTTNQPIIYEGYEGSCKVGTDGRDPLPSVPTYNPIISPTPSTSVYRENFEIPHSKVLKVRNNESGWVNTTCGYNPLQVSQSNLPSNMSSGNCEQSEEMKQYNKNLFTQNIQPDVYTRNEIIEPINSNIGISFTQQLEPVTCSRTDGNGLTYTEHDPRIYQPEIEPYEPDMSVTEANVYDPRFSGYGTSYRSYNDDNTGQTRFYYDDINSVRMPNYISRSNIDFARYADTYGPMHDNNKKGNQYNSNIRALAQNTFLTSSLQQRNSLQQSLMRKRNAEMWQLRKYPTRTFGGQGSTC